MAFPASKTTFTDPSGTSPVTSPDHAALHTSVNDTLEAIQDTYGTTAGTNILKDFSAGQFPVRTNSAGVIAQTLSGGTVNNSVFGTPAITGGTVNNVILGTPAITGGTVNSAVMGTPTIIAPVVTVGSDAQGDIYYRSAAGVFTRLAPGTSGQFLKTQGAGANPAWADFTMNTTAKVRAKNTAVQSIPNTTSTKVAFDTMLYDPGANFSLVNDRYTAPITGYYQASGGIVMASSSVADLHVYLIVTGTSANTYLGTRSTAQGAIVSDIIHMTAGDYVELFVYQASGSAVDTGPVYNNPFLAVHLVSI